VLFLSLAGCALTLTHSHLLLALTLSLGSNSLALHYSPSPSRLDFTARLGSVLRRIGRGASPRHRLRVDAKIATFRGRLAVRVGKLARV